jgi:hypothetical protein
MLTNRGIFPVDDPVTKDYSEKDEPKGRTDGM